MSNLQEKYKSYKTPFEASAFEHFQSIREEDKPGKRGVWWYLVGIILLLLIPADSFVVFLNSNEAGVAENVVEVPQEEIRQHSKPKMPSTEDTSQNDGETIIKKEQIAGTTNILNEAVEEESPPIHREQNREIINMPSNIEANSLGDARSNFLPNQHLITQNNNALIDKKDVIQNQLPINTTQKIIDVVSPKNIIQKNKKAILFEPKQIAVPTQLLNPLNTDLAPISNIAPTGPKLHRRNHMKLSYNYADFYWNGALGESLGTERADKKGYLIQGEYFRELNKILSIGTSAGYSRGVDINNQELDTLDYENITFAHLNLYLFLVNSPKHQLYFKAGTGITNTKRLSSSFAGPLNMPYRELDYSNLTNTGLLVEFSYSYHLTDQWFMSTNFGAITHNDGAWYTGLSLGYSF